MEVDTLVLSEWHKGEEKMKVILTHPMLVGGFNPFEKYSSKWESSPSRGENKKYLKPPPSMAYFTLHGIRLIVFNGKLVW